MKRTVTINYYNKIKSVLPPTEFKCLEGQLKYAPNEKLEALWNIIVAGYPPDFALLNYVKLYDFLQDKAMEYEEALITFVTYPGLRSGILLQKTKWFELN